MPERRSDGGVYPDREALERALLLSQMWAILTVVFVIGAVAMLFFPLHYDTLSCGPLVAPEDPLLRDEALCNSRRTQQLSWSGLVLAIAVISAALAFLTRPERIRIKQLN
ncbi:hypothetical protein [Streptomyces sp. NPDC048172]|uniref:hypothetical protein n=1 Tax=Streptomyces sp. NPDC048172 TaxID=3365505 RepID=UPI00371A252F